MQNRGLNELLCAAMINRNFCEILITDPSLALSEGYEGHVFNLAPEEYNLVTHIQAINLEDFAEQVLRLDTGQPAQAMVSLRHRRGFLLSTPSAVQAFNRNPVSRIYPCLSPYIVMTNTISLSLKSR
jgi:hypothetical protein